MSSISNSTTLCYRVTSSETDRFRAILRSYRAGDRSEPIPNLRPWQCKVAVEELLLLANEMQKKRKTDPNNPSSVLIRVLTGYCPAHVYGSVDFHTFLMLGGELRVLIWNEGADLENGPLTSIAAQFPQTVSVRHANSPHSSPPINHFLIVDEKAYRLEAIHEKRELFDDMEPEIPARINFNDPHGAQSLATAFDDVWAKTRPIVLAR